MALIEARRVAVECLGSQYRVCGAGFSQDVQSVVDRCGLERAKELVGAVGGRRRICAQPDRGNRYAGRRSGGWLARCVEGRSRRRACRFCHVCWDRSSARRSRAGRPKRCATRSRPTHYFHAIHFPKAFHIHPLNYAFGLAAAAEKAGVRIFEESPATSLDPPPACASACRRRRRGCGRIMSCSRAMSISAIAAAETGANSTAGVGLCGGDGAAGRPAGRRPSPIAAASATRGYVDNPIYRIVGGDRLMWAGGCTAWEANAGARSCALKQSLMAIYPQLGPVNSAMPGLAPWAWRFTGCRR